MTLVIFLYALFGSSFPISKMLLNYTTPIFFLGSRMTVAGILLITYQYIRDKHKLIIHKSHYLYFIQLIAIGMYLNYLLRFWALSQMPSAKVSFLFNFSPFFSALYSYFLLNERISRIQWVGLGIGFIGLAPIMMTTSLSEQKLGEFFFISWQELATLGSVALHSYCWIIVRTLVKEKHYTPMMVNGIGMISGGILALITSYYFDGLFPVSNPVMYAKWFVVIVIISNIICHNLYAYLLRHYTATFMSFAGFLGPLFSALYAWGLLNETITWHFFASAVLVFIGLYLFYREELSRQKGLQV
jgi:drug/metabolite transporter (DMT)-like permease